MIGQDTILDDERAEVRAEDLAYRDDPPEEPEPARHPGRHYPGCVCRRCRPNGDRP